MNPLNCPPVTVPSAMRCLLGDLWTSFSNYGNPPIDYCATGVNIYSCYKGGGSATMSGTSMVAQHGAGILLLRSPKDGGEVSGNPDGNPEILAIS